MSETVKYRAEFTIVPGLIYLAPAFIFFPGMFAAFGIYGILSALLPLLTLFLILFLSVKRISAVVYEDVFEWKISILTKSVKRIEGSKIESVDFRESIIGRSRWGSVTVRGAGTRALRIRNVKQPELLAEHVRSIAALAHPKISDKTSNLSNSLIEISKLHEKGVLSDEEFERAKKKLL